jgi:hypothetical protein
MLNTFLGGAIVLGSWAIALFFFRFQKATRDRLFGFFAAAFLLLGLERVGLEFMSGEPQSLLYLIRLLAFLLILLAIWDKNRTESKR